MQLRHWEKALRELAARALGALVPSSSPWLATTALDCALGLCTDGVRGCEVIRGGGGCGPTLNPWGGVGWGGWGGGGGAKH
jgi:hypothetical protein